MSFHDITPTRFEALKLAIEAYGSQENLARRCKVSQTTVHRWFRRSKQLPAEFVLMVEADTGVSRHWLRPDIYPVEPRFHGLDLRASRVSFNPHDFSKDAQP